MADTAVTILDSIPLIKEERAEPEAVKDKPLVEVSITEKNKGLEREGSVKDLRANASQVLRNVFALDAGGEPVDDDEHEKDENEGNVKGERPFHKTQRRELDKQTKKRMHDLSQPADIDAEEWKSWFPEDALKNLTDENQEDLSLYFSECVNGNAHKKSLVTILQQIPNFAKQNGRWYALKCFLRLCKTNDVIIADLRQAIGVKLDATSLQLLIKRSVEQRDMLSKLSTCFNDHDATRSNEYNHLVDIANTMRKTAQDQQDDVKKLKDELDRFTKDAADAKTQARKELDAVKKQSEDDLLNAQKKAEDELTAVKEQSQLEMKTFKTVTLEKQREMNKRATLLEEKFARTHDKMMELSTVADDLRKELVASKSELELTKRDYGAKWDDATAQMREMNSTIGKLSDRVSQQAGVITDLKRTVADQASTIQTLNERVSEQAKTISCLCTELEMERTEKKNLIVKCDTLMAENHRLSKALAEATEKVAVSALAMSLLPVVQPPDQTKDAAEALTKEAASVPIKEANADLEKEAGAASVPAKEAGAALEKEAGATKEATATSTDEEDGFILTGDVSAPSRTPSPVDLKAK
jgi:uncharacterized coiled-coil protein SlyX